MARGKQTCRILKDIRRRIAEANDIEFVTSECRYRGDCLGTCPKCEAEVRYLEEQLASRRLAGKAVILAGLTVLSACGNSFATAPMEDVEACSSDKISEESTSDDHKIMLGEFIDTANIDINEPLNIAFVSVRPDLEAIEKYIAERLQYPKAALDEGVEGRVVVQLIVDSTGRVTEPRIVRCLHPALDKEVLRLVSLLQYVRPAEFRGQKVSCEVTVPVLFKLPEDKSDIKKDKDVK